MVVVVTAKAAVAGKQFVRRSPLGDRPTLLGIMMNEQYYSIVDTLPHSMVAKNVESEPSLDEAVKYIERIDFSAIQEKLCSDDPLLCRRWSPLGKV